MQKRATRSPLCLGMEKKPVRFKAVTTLKRETREGESNGFSVCRKTGAKTEDQAGAKTISREQCMAKSQRREKQVADQGRVREDKEEWRLQIYQG